MQCAISEPQPQIKILAPLGTDVVRTRYQIPVWAILTGRQWDASSHTHPEQVFKDSAQLWLFCFSICAIVQASRLRVVRDWWLFVALVLRALSFPPSFLPPKAWKYFSCFFCNKSVSKIKHLCSCFWIPVMDVTFWFKHGRQGFALGSSTLQLASSPSFLTVYGIQYVCVYIILYMCILYVHIYIYIRMYIRTLGENHIVCVLSVHLIVE